MGRNKAFVRWLSQGPRYKEKLVMDAIAYLLPTLEAAGFEWVEKRLDGELAQVNAVSLEWEGVKGQIDFISIIFDKYRGLKFQVALGTKEKAPPHRWVKGGRIVQKKSGLEKHNWWGARWWHLNKEKSFELSVKEMSSILSQATGFLSGGAAGPNIWESRIGDGGS